MVTSTFLQRTLFPTDTADIHLMNGCLKSETNAISNGSTGTESAADTSLWMLARLISDIAADSRPNGRHAERAARRDMLQSDGGKHPRPPPPTPDGRTDIGALKANAQRRQLQRRGSPPTRSVTTNQDTSPTRGQVRIGLK